METGFPLVVPDCLAHGRERARVRHDALADRKGKFIQGISPATLLMTD